MKEIYEKLGAFYLGKSYDLASRRLAEELILYDSKDLNTHAVIIGMTGSGKTGLGVSILEEALIDNIPIIAIDPKGDLPNLLLSFPDFNPKDFRPWVNPQDALNKGLTLDQFAANQAATWQKGLAQWGQEADRVARFKASADFTVYTPGSYAGLPVNVLRSFSPPDPSILRDPDLLRDQIQTTATSLLALLGIDADPLLDREHILISNILETVWAGASSLDLAGLINAIQKPPFEQIGVMDLESFYPAKERFALAMRMNNLLASPGFDSWMEGDPLNIGQMLYTPQGKPRANIFTISHLSDSERMFFVSMLLNEILGWMRSQPGTASLRAILYIDEIFGYFPPVGNPPSKRPLLTLLKQARAFGLGVVMSTQNPVDLDYKGLANTGTWFIGRLQTERDKARVMEGLEGAAAGSGFDRSRMDEILAGLGKRVFLLHNVHENEPAIFQTRWALSYLRGPMTRDQIKVLMADRTTQRAAIPTNNDHPLKQDYDKFPEQAQAAKGPPVLSPGIDTFHLAASGTGHGIVYFPAVVGCMDVYYSSARYKVDKTDMLAIAVQLDDSPTLLDWDNAVEFNPQAVRSTPMTGGEYADLPAGAKRASTYRKWNKDLLRWVRQKRPMVLIRSKRFRMTSQLGESENEFRMRLAQVAREKRDLKVEKLRRRYEKRYSTLKDRLMRAEQATEREGEQVKAKKMQTAISFGTAILGAFLGRKAVSATSASRVGTAMRSASRVNKEKMDVVRAQERAEAIRGQLSELDDRLQDDIDNFTFSMGAEDEVLETINVKPKSTDIHLELFGLAWIPYRKDMNGGLHPDWSQ